MLINADIKGLEVVVAAQLSGDKVLTSEIIEFHQGLRKLDVHGQNQLDFKLPSRLIAKIFKFRLIYGGEAYSYANDPDFMGVSTNQKYWQEVIDNYYNKYKGIEAWHKRLIHEAQTTGRIVIPSGRYFPITPDYTKQKPWPITVIKNYPVQGFGADLVLLARLDTKRLLREAGIEREALLVSTVHDSIVVDAPSRLVPQVASLLEIAIASIPQWVERVFNYTFNLPLSCEIKVGPNLLDMQDYSVV